MKILEVNIIYQHSYERGTSMVREMTELINAIYKIRKYDAGKMMINVQDLIYLDLFLLKI